MVERGKNSDFFIISRQLLKINSNGPLNLIN